jgi:hypothetical protein
VSLGKLGRSGDSSGPHLHYQLQSGRAFRSVRFDSALSKVSVCSAIAIGGAAPRSIRGGSLTPELSFAEVQWSANERELHEWQCGERDCNWAAPAITRMETCPRVHLKAKLTFQ